MADKYVPRLKKRYNEEIRAQLLEELGLSNIMQVPKPEKAVVNMGVGRGLTRRKAHGRGGERPHDDHRSEASDPRARKSIATFKIREGMPIGAADNDARRPHVGVRRPA